MNLRCKTGDLAVIVRASLPENIGRFCAIVRIYGAAPNAWEIEMHHPCRMFHYNGDIQNSALIGYALDADLRPIRDPGDDAVDETIARLGAPNKQGETA